MAFTAPLVVAGRNYPTAYIKATVRFCDAGATIIQLHAWETQELRQEGVPQLVWDKDLRTFDTVDLQAVNPVHYGYQLLEASGEFPEATWNV